MNAYLHYIIIQQKYNHSICDLEVAIQKKTSKNHSFQKRYNKDTEFAYHFKENIIEKTNEKNSNHSLKIR